MSKRHDIRRLAMQLLYQIDATGGADRAQLAADLDDEAGPPQVRAEAVQVAAAAWSAHDDYDAKVSALTPDWPTHRQPPVDRAILRLAVHEMVTGRTPPRVAINQAVELAKEFSNEQAPPFVNGVLDKLHRTLDLPQPDPAADDPDADPRPAPDAEAWLDDARSEV